MDMTTKEKDFIFAIEDYDIVTIKHFIDIGIHKNFIFTKNQEMALMPFSVFMLSEDNDDFCIGLKIIILFLKNNIDINMKSNTGNTALTATPKNSFSLVKLLLIAGANPNIINLDEKNTALSYIISDKKEISTSNLLLEYGAYVNINKKYNFLCNCTLLEKSIMSGTTVAIYALLANGANTAYTNEFGDNMLQTLEEHKEKYTQEEYQTLQTLLNPKNPPYLKLSDSDKDKYIIYENKSRGQFTFTNIEPYLLADKRVYQNKKYLYADNKIDVFVYWAYKKDLIDENHALRFNKIDMTEEISVNKLDTFILNTLGHEVSTDIFNSKGKAFAIGYLAVTQWWYNLHHDFNKLYQSSNTKLPRAIKNKEEFDTLIKLLDIRYKQFKSGEDFNSNQNKAELQALIEGKEPPKREVDLSWLEECCE